VLLVRSTTVKSWLNQLKNAVTGYLARHNRVRLALPILGEIALVVAIIAFAAWRFWTPLEFAANMPQEATKYGVGAWNLYKTGRYEFVINHQHHPAMGGLGYGFLIVPSFWLFGEFLGNAIYTQCALAILTCVGLYAAVRQCLGVWAGLLAALALPTYGRFEEYTHLLDTSIPSAFFFVAGLLIFLWILRDARARWGQWLAWGLCAGWATTVRSNDAIVYTVLTVVLLWQLRPTTKDACKWLFATAVGVAPLILLQLWYNHHYCGAWYRDAHAYWTSVPSDNLSRTFGLRFAFGLPTPKVQMYDRGNLAFYLQLIAGHFTLWKDLPNYFSPWGRVLVFALAGVTFGGICFGFQRATTTPQTRDFVRYGVTTIGATLLFYSCFWFRASRFIGPIAPFCAAFLGVGIVDTIRWLWRRHITVVLVPGLILVLAVPAKEAALNHTTVIGDLLPVADLLRQVDADVEHNAVIITGAGPPLVEHYVVRDTARQIVPLNHKRHYRVQPRPPKDPAKIPQSITNTYEGDLENGAVDIFEFSALEDPDRIQQLLDAGLPVYVIDHTFGSAINSDLESLAARFDLQGFRQFTLGGLLAPFFPHAVVCVWKLTTRVARGDPQ
jgi:hypothetical protein